MKRFSHWWCGRVRCSAFHDASTLFLLSLVLLAMVGCDRTRPATRPAANASGDPTPSAADPVPIPCFATIYPLADLARQIGGGLVSVDWYAEAGDDPEHPRESADAFVPRLNRAKLILTSGWPDGWADARYAADYRNDHVLRPENLPLARQTADEARWPGGAVDKPWWLDPAVATALALSLRDHLCTLDVTHEADYRQNAEVFIGQLDALSEEYRRRLAPFRGRAVIELHGSLPPTWLTLARRFGLESLSPVDADPRQLSDDDIGQLRQTAQSAKVTLLLVPADLPSAVVRRLAERTGLRVVPLDPFGTSAANGRNTYLKLMRYNLTQLADALEGERQAGKGGNAGHTP